MNEAAIAAGSAGDAWGWAVLGGIEIKTPMIAPGDSIMLQGVYSKGAVEYTGISSSPLGVAQGIGFKNLGGVGPSTDIWDSALVLHRRSPTIAVLDDCLVVERDVPPLLAAEPAFGFLGRREPV